MHQRHRALPFLALVEAAAVLAAPVPLPKGGGGRGGGGGGGRGGGSRGGSSSSSSRGGISGSSPAGTAIYGNTYPRVYYGPYGYGYWVYVPSSNGCVFYNEDGLRVDGTYRSSCDRLSNSNGISASGIVMIVLFVVAIALICLANPFRPCSIPKNNKEKPTSNTTSSSPRDSAPAAVAAKDYAPPTQVTYQGSLAAPVHRATADAAARGREFINNTPPMPFNPTPEALDAMANPAAWALALPFQDMASFVGVAPEDGTVHFFPNPITRASADTDLTLVSNLPVPWLLPAHAQPPPPVLYYEVTVVAMAPQTTLAIGLATVPYPYFRLPGWHDWSVGYHSDDGRVFCDNDGDGDAYGKPFRVDDVIGVGLRTADGSCFFTRNGVVLPTVEGPRAPCPETAVHIAVGADGPCAVRLNCGQLPFRCAQFNSNPEQGVRGAGYAVERLPVYSVMPTAMPEPPMDAGAAPAYATMNMPQPPPPSSSTAGAAAAPVYPTMSMPQPPMVSATNTTPPQYRSIDAYPPPPALATPTSATLAAPPAATMQMPSPSVVAAVPLPPSPLIQPIGMTGPGAAAAVPNEAASSATTPLVAYPSAPAAAVGKLLGFGLPLGLIVYFTFWIALEGVALFAAAFYGLGASSITFSTDTNVCMNLHKRMFPKTFASLVAPAVPGAAASAEIALASSSSSSKVFSSSAKLPLNGTSISMPENKQTTNNNECVDSTPTPTAGTLKHRFEQLALAPGSSKSRSPCSRSKDQVHIAHFGGDAKNQLGQGNNETKSVPACAVTAAVVLEALAGVHVSTLRASFEPAAVAAVTPAIVPTTQTAVVDAPVSTAASIKLQETSTCTDPAGTVATEFSTLFESTNATHAPAVTAQAEKKRSTAGNVLRWAKVAAVAESMAIDSNLVKLPAELGSDQTLVESASSSRWSTIKDRFSNLLGGASSTVKVSAKTSEPRSTKFGVKVLPTSSAPVVLRSAVAAVDVC
ncbi:hypothetical protein H9P43_003634 [Blastocladiella emersonii ATCC 22665]|nr:hypothetical protein H9P43_003634 [Blastocladiella emersonii ATCC 22665]